MTPQRIAVIGTGYVGCVSAACLAQLGHQVTGLDRDLHKVKSILQGRAPFFEPGLDELIAANVAAGRLTASAESEAALTSADIVLICVGTPSLRNGDPDLSQLRRAAVEIAACAAKRSQPLIVVVRSTVSPGTCESLIMPMLTGTPCTVVSNPEFLREGVAVRDFMEPGLLVVGGSEANAVRQVADIYSGIPVSAQLVSLRTAEMIKYACNSYHAVKIAFANEVGALSEAMGVNGVEVMSTLCQDRKLNSSAAYLKPGFAFGGSCLPKDLRALSSHARKNHLELPLLTSTLGSNHEHLRRATEAVLDWGDVQIGVLGLAFKEDTDDLRESPVLAMLETLIGKGRKIRVYDPHIQLENIHGANRAFALDAIPHIGRLMTNLFDLMNWSELLVIAQKPGAELMERIQASELPVLDLVSGSLPVGRLTIAQAFAA
jgi:GDP-mannose 6-dehydrogenase